MLGVDDKAAGLDALTGTAEDARFLRQRIYANTRPQLTLAIEELQFGTARLLIITVPEGLDLVTDSKGKALRRDGTSCHPLTEDARRAIAHERRNPDLTARPSERDWTQVQPRAMNEARYLLAELVDLRAQMAELDDLNLLRALNVVDRDDRLLIAGEVLFCAPAQDTLDLLVRSASGGEPSVRRLREPLVTLLPHALNLIRSSIDPEVAHIALLSGQEVALPDFSPIAVDEAVTNALVHRDYSLAERVVVDQSPNVTPRLVAGRSALRRRRRPAAQHRLHAEKPDPHGRLATTGAGRASLARDRSHVQRAGPGRSAGSGHSCGRVLGRGLLQQWSSRTGRSRASWPHFRSR